MPSRRSGTPSDGGSYQRELRRAIDEFLPRRSPKGGGGDRRMRWAPRLLVTCAVLMAWDAGATLAERFAAARAALVGMFPGRRRPGRSYAGFAAALARRSDVLLGAVTVSLRAAVGDVGGGVWESAGGWVVFGCDASKVDCPRTAANERAFGTAGRRGSGPQMLLTTLFHAATGLPWAFARGPARDSERSHLLSMLDTLPRAALLLADAGFTGYELLSAVIGSGRSFVIRVGANVGLLTKLGYAVREFDGLVYLWPARARRRRQPPMVLRLVRLADGRNRNRVVYLLTDVLDAGRLSDAAAGELYRLRWGVELLYRALKQTMRRRKMLSDSPAHARAELDWSVVGLWLLALMNAKAAGVQRPGSPAAALRVVRRAMAGRPAGGGRRRRRVRAALSRCHAADGYTRRGVKAARRWPHKKRDRPPGAPRARTATEDEVRLARSFVRGRAA